MDLNDLDLFNKFMPPGEEPTLDLNTPQTSDPKGGVDLAGLILRQIAAHEAAQEDRPEVIGGGAPEDAIEIPLKVVEVYTKYLFLDLIRSGAC